MEVEEGEEVCPLVDRSRRSQTPSPEDTGKGKSKSSDEDDRHQELMRTTERITAHHTVQQHSLKY